jgi:cold shock CspA family protein
MSSNDDVTIYTTVDRLIGRVKWFNNKAGYGFITVTDNCSSKSLPSPGSDIFVHHSAIQVENQQYRYLVQGEYVEFALSNTPTGNHEYQASHVCGIKSGKLMCETRREFKIAKSSYRATKSEVENKDIKQDNKDFREPRQKQVPRARGEGPRESINSPGEKDWTIVGEKKVEPKRRGRPVKTPLV